MAKTVKDFVMQATATTPSLDPAQAKEKLQGDNTLLLDVRDPSELPEKGKLKGSVNVSRGMLEFSADPATPYYNDELRPDRTVLVHCASGKRALLAARTLREMGFDDTYAIGGLEDLVKAGFESEPG